MKIYSKIMLMILPLIVIPVAIISLIAFYLSRTAILSMAQETLRNQLANAIDICSRQTSNIQTLGENETIKLANAQAAAIEKVEAITFGETGYTMVVDSTGFIIAHPNYKYIQQTISGETWFNLIKNIDKSSFVYTWESKKRLAQFQRFPDWGWYVISSKAESEILSPVDRLGLYIGGLLALSLLIAFLAIRSFAHQLTAPIQTLLAGTDRIRAGELAVPIPITTNDEFGTLANAFNNMTDHLRDVIGNLEQRFTGRTQDLEQRALQLQTASEIAQEATSAQDLDTLLSRSVNLIQERFNFYHVSIYTPDEQRQYAVLRAGAGEVGKEMAQRGYRMRIGDVGIVSHVAETGELRVINDVKADFTFLKHPLLPDTACAAALPMKAGGRIIGVLDVESKRVNDFTQDSLAVLQTLSDQLAIAIDNTRLFEELRTSLQETRTLYQQFAQESWSRATQSNMNSGYQFDLSKITPYTRDLPAEIQSQLLEGKAVKYIDRNNGEENLSDLKVKQSERNDRSMLIAPLIMHDQLIGVLGVEAENPDHEWLPEETALLETISNQVALTLENARLLEVTQHRAARDRMVAEITNKMRRAVDMDTLIQTAVREITRAIDVPEAFVQLRTQSETQNKMATQSSPEIKTGDTAPEAELGR
jgi:GAF domain-containing protein/HAMP domain-containing protein